MNIYLTTLHILTLSLFFKSLNEFELSTKINKRYSIQRDKLPTSKCGNVLCKTVKK